MHGWPAVSLACAPLFVVASGTSSTRSVDVHRLPRLPGVYAPSGLRDAFRGAARFRHCISADTPPVDLGIRRRRTRGYYSLRAQRALVFY